MPTMPGMVTPPGDPDAPAPEAEASVPQGAEPMSAEEAGAVQSDGKSMPDSFPVRNINALAPMM